MHVEMYTPIAQEQGAPQFFAVQQVDPNSANWPGQRYELHGQGPLGKGVYQ
jgi:hypothetical protein